MIEEQKKIEEKMERRKRFLDKIKKKYEEDQSGTHPIKQKKYEKSDKMSTVKSNEAIIFHNVIY